MEKSSKKRALFCLGTAAYFISYICRLNLTAAMPEMMGSGSFTAAKLGIITSVYFVCYGVGQLFGGPIFLTAASRRSLDRVSVRGSCLQPKVM